MQIKVLSEETIETIALPPGYRAAEDEILTLACKCPPDCDNTHEQQSQGRAEDIIWHMPGRPVIFNPDEHHHFLKTDRTSDYAKSVRQLNITAEVDGQTYSVAIPLFRWTEAKSWKDCKCEEVKLTEAEIDAEIVKQVKAQMASIEPKRIIEA